MSNLPPNPYNNITLPPQMNTNSGSQIPAHNQQYGQVPLSQLPPGYANLKQDANSNSPVPFSGTPQSGILQNVNNSNQSSNSSPAFNQPGMMPQPQGFHSSPLRPPIKPLSPNPVTSFPSSSPITSSNANTPSPYPPNYNPQPRQINENTPPLIPSSQYQSVVNGPPGPPGPVLPPTSSQYPVSSSSYSPAIGVRPPVSSFNAGAPPAPINQGLPPPINTLSGPQPGLLTSQPNMPFSGPPRHSPLITGPAPSGSSYNGPPTNISSIPQSPPHLFNGPSSMGAIPGVPPVSMAQMGNTMLPRPPAPMPMMPPVSGPPAQQFSGPPKNGPDRPIQPMMPPGINNSMMSGPQSLPPGLQAPSMTQPMGPPPSIPGPPSGPTGGPPKNIQNRYPPMPQSNLVNHQPMGQQPMGQQPMVQPPMGQQPMMGKQYPQQYNTQAMTQQMGQLSVTKQGFDQLWGHQMIDLLQCRHILPEYPEDPPEIRLGHQFADSPNCSPE
jgi:hypothetical protein